ncbi:hypothetical protein XFF6970_1010028 [Xanthomonas citri pv. fuscans]|nr:hypothetical protein XFF6960_360029 [Xanthomonas citri pv. fuscans]SOO07715.1 hypothetical protein XFF6970_1010028 [Xanthomonas citri pv. fuscans]SOO13167.1 hypothetical protein XFF7766_1210028 [Xanthomonas citri pv. fuscans]
MTLRSARGQASWTHSQRQHLQSLMARGGTRHSALERLGRIKLPPGQWWRRDCVVKSARRSG